MAQADSCFTTRRSILAGTAASALINFPAAVSASTVSSLTAFDARLRAARSDLDAAQDAVSEITCIIEDYDTEHPRPSLPEPEDGEDSKLIVAAYDRSLTEHCQQRIAFLRTSGIASAKQRVAQAEAALHRICIEVGMTRATTLVELRMKAAMIDCDTGPIAASIVTDLLDREIA